jgi:hypothetical protein
MADLTISIMAGRPLCLVGLRGAHPAGRYASAVSARSILLIVSPAATTA